MMVFFMNLFGILHKVQDGGILHLHLTRNGGPPIRGMVITTRRNSNADSSRATGYGFSFFLPFFPPFQLLE
jgi:hypothetical protein